MFNKFFTKMAEKSFQPKPWTRISDAISINRAKRLNAVVYKENGEILGVDPIKIRAADMRNNALMGVIMIVGCVIANKLADRDWNQTYG